MGAIKITNKFIKLFVLLFALFCLFASCKEPDNPAQQDDDYYNPNAGGGKGNNKLTFSKDSGLHSEQFDLVITASSAGSKIYYSTDGNTPTAEKAASSDYPYVFEYTAPITVKNRNGEPNILATPKNLKQMYLVQLETDGQDDPRGSIPKYFGPSKDQVPKATVISAVAVDSQGKASDVVTRTYFIGDNLNGYGNHRIISFVTDPANLLDEDKGIMVRGKPENRWDGPIYNFQQKGREEWERPAYFELFESNRSSAALSDIVGIRVRGGYSRAQGQKSLNVTFRNDWGGRNELKNYKLIPGAVKADGSDVDLYKSFMLRSGGNDHEQTKFKDVFIQDLVKDRKFTTQAAVPAIVYINGEYWGPYNLQERYSDWHTQAKYGINRDNVILFENDVLDEGTDDGSFAQMMSFGDKDMSNPSNYSDFCEIVDIESFIDYWAVQIYIFNEDWPHNNYHLWKARTPVSGNPYGDGKWRYQLHDTEFSLGIYSSGSLSGQDNKGDPFNFILNGEHNGNKHNKLFIALMENENFKRQFVNTMLDLYNVNFLPEKFNPKLNEYVSIYKDLMDGEQPGTYNSRWGHHWQTVQAGADDARNYLTNVRSAMVNNYLPNYFSGIASGLYDITVSSPGVNASIKVNTVTVNGIWTGQYYSGNPITVEAIVPAGQEFDKWEITGGTADDANSPSAKITITGNALIRAKYKSVSGDTIPVESIALNLSTITFTDTNPDPVTITAEVSPENATYKNVFWTSSNSDIATVDSNGIVKPVGNGTTTITASTAENITATCSVIVDMDEVLLGSYPAYYGNPYNLLHCPVNYEIVNLVNEGRNEVIKVDCDVNNEDARIYQYVRYSLEEYRGKRIRISFGAEVKREGSPGDIEWMVSLNGSTTIGEKVISANDNEWYQFEGEGIYEISTDSIAVQYPEFVLPSFYDYNNNLHAVYYIDNFTVEVEILPTEELVASYGANAGNPYNQLTSPVSYDIVNLPEENNRTEVMKIDYDGSDAFAVYSLEAYRGKKIKITYSAEVKRVGSSGNIRWEGWFQPEQYPNIGEEIFNANENQWYQCSGEHIDTVLADYTNFILSAWTSYNMENYPEYHGGNPVPMPIFYIDNFTITVTEITPITDIELDPPALEFTDLTPKQIAANITPTNATEPIIWSSGDSSVAVVDSAGKVTPTGNGTTIITAETSGGTATCSVTVDIENLSESVLLDLAGTLSTMSPRTFTDNESFTNTFSNGTDMAVRAADEFAGVSYEIVNDRGVNKILVNEFKAYAAGLEVTNGSINFKAGDRIQVKGTLLSAITHEGVHNNEMFVNIDVWGYTILQGWRNPFADGEDFEHTFTLTESDADTINTNSAAKNRGAFRVKTGGVPPYDGTIYPEGISSFYVDQIKITRLAAE